MPIYTYKCLKCNKQVDKLIKFSDTEKKQECDCGEELLLIPTYSTSFSLKGKWFNNGGY